MLKHLRERLALLICPELSKKPLPLYSWINPECTTSSSTSSMKVTYRNPGSA